MGCALVIVGVAVFLGTDLPSLSDYHWLGVFIIIAGFFWPTIEVKK